jgi:hypothetical protein
MLMVASMILFLGGCRKDEVLLHQSSTSLNTQKNAKRVEKVKFEEVSQIWDMVQREIRRANGSRNTVFKDTDIKKDFVVVFHFSDSLKQTTFRLPDINGEHFNLAVQTENDVLSNIKILGFKDFPGSERELTQYSFESGFGSGGRTESLLIACLKLRFKYRPVRTAWIDPTDYSPWDGEGHNFNEGESNGGIIRDLWGINWGDGNSVIYTSGSNGSGNNTGGGSGGSNGGNSGGNNPCPAGEHLVTAIVYTPFGSYSVTFCDFIKPLQEGNSGSRNSIKECDKLLKELGIIDIGGAIIPDKIDEALEECRESNPEVQEKINEIADGSFKNVCEGTQLEFNPWELEYQLCLTGEYNEEAVEKWLEEETDGKEIIIYKSLQFSSCPKLKCVLDNIINGNLNSILTTNFCNKFNTSNKPIIAIKFASFKTLNLNPNALANASTFIRPDGGVDHTMIFNSDVCNNNSDPLDMYETFSHESLHNLINDELITLYGWNGKLATRNAAFVSMMNTKYPGNTATNDHELMLTIHLNDMINNLKSVNGNLTGTASNGMDIYLGIILYGYGGDLPFIQSHFGLSASDISTMHQEFLNWQNANQSTSGIYSVCP